MIAYRYGAHLTNTRVLKLFTLLLQMLNRIEVGRKTNKRNLMHYRQIHPKKQHLKII